MDTIAYRPQTFAYAPDAMGNNMDEARLGHDDDVLDLLPLEDMQDLVPRYGGTSSTLDALGGLLGSAVSTTAGGLADDPRVVALVQEGAETCRERAKMGVNEWIVENKESLMLAAGTAVGVLLIGHFFLSVAALSLAFPRAAFARDDAP